MLAGKPLLVSLSASFAVLAVAFAACERPVVVRAEEAARGPIIAHPVRTLEGDRMNLGQFRGQVLLIVNTASECGYTSQYTALETLFRRYEARGLLVLGFPSNDFMGQEPGDAKQIRKFITEAYGITFPMFEKQTVAGREKSPLYRTLTDDLPGDLAGEIGWNFTKFLVDPSGHVVARFPTDVDPLDAGIISAIEANLPVK